MTLAGWIIMIVSVGSVTGVFLWSLWLVLTTPHEIEHVHGFEQTPENPEG
jgi:hypothetical protein